MELKVSRSGCNRSDMPANTFIFNHVPKTGGTSFLAICRANLAPHEISPHLNDHSIRLIPGDRFEHFRLVTGHISLSTQMNFASSRYSMTLLREPIRRIISTYCFWRKAQESDEVTKAAKHLSLREFVQYYKDSPSVVHNRYIYHFAGITRDSPCYSGDPASLLNTAKRNLEAFNFVGICEDLERSIRVLCSELQWRIPESIPYENRSHSEMAWEAIDQETMALLTSQNSLDLELYDFAVSLFRAKELGKQNTREANHFITTPASATAIRRARIHVVETQWRLFGDTKVLEIAVEFRVEIEVDRLVLGVAIYDENGNEVWGTNTTNEKVALQYATGADSRAVFALRLNARVGKYHITVALAQLRRLGFHEQWLDRAASFEVGPGDSDSSGGCLSHLLDFQSSVHQKPVVETVSGRYTTQGASHPTDPSR